jgi:hypothetical protein
MAIPSTLIATISAIRVGILSSGIGDVMLPGSYARLLLLS